MSETQESVLPRRQGVKIRDDAAAKHVRELLRQVAARVKEKPAVAPPEEGMVRLGGRDRASYVWFLRCPESYTPPAPVSGGGLCNHGIGVDRHHHGDYEVRAWAHGAPGVHAVSLHTHEVTLEILETVAGLVGIPLEEPERKPETWVHGTRLGRDHTDLALHLVEDHGFHVDYVDSLGDGGMHGLHDGQHGNTWAYAADLPHERCSTLTLDERPAQHLKGTRPRSCSECSVANPQEYSFSDPEGA